MDFNDAINKMIEEVVEDKLSEFKPEIDAGDVDGLEDMIDERAADVVRDEIKALEVDADAVSGLDDAIEAVINDKVEDAVIDYFHHHLLVALEKIAATEEGKTRLRGLITSIFTPDPVPVS